MDKYYCVPNNVSIVLLIRNVYTQVWASVGGALISVSLVLFFLARLTPHEWLAIEPSHVGVGVGAAGGVGAGAQADSLLENRFTLLNSFWLIVGSLFQQGTRSACRMLSNFQSDLTSISMSSQPTYVYE